ncbi:NAD binding domain of 6-phosphogluconate dehydrogenase-domain-containing protein [Aspergillus karnatakaensis]|uniref:NAD(P)-dependent oxidoreductase n=1 Tax=Aspergillus karnatakaensis TaxID=1810916 RepID=UPI003CCE053C
MSSPTKTPRLGWIGLGSMGLPMATNIQTHLKTTDSPPLTIYNRTPTRGAPLLSLGAIQAPTIEALIAQVDICFISVSDDAAASSIITSILLIEETITGKTIVDTSTVHPDLSGYAQRTLAERGVHFVAAPVFGASPVAREGRLLVILAGLEEAVKIVEPFLVGVIARKVLRVGTEAGKASLVKTAGNFLTAGIMELIAESLVFAEKTAIPTSVMQELLGEQYGALPLTMSKRMLEGHYLPARGERPWSDLRLAVKDVGLGVDCAERVGASLPVAEVVLGNYKEAREFGEAEGRELDSSAMYGVLRRRAGLGFESEVVRERDAAES